MNDREKILLGIIAMGVLAAILWYGFSVPENRTQVGMNNNYGESITRDPVSKNIEVPDEGEKNIPANIAVPENVTPIAPGSSASYRTFDIKITGNKFVPETIVAKAYDSLRLRFTAIDKSYDFTQPDLGYQKPIPLPQGKTLTMDFQVSAVGKFTFYCTSCGGPEKGPLGYIEVVPK